MNEEAFNLSVRKFLKSFGLNAQREIEHAVAKALASGKINRTGSLPGKVRLEIPGLSLNVDFNGEIALK